MFIARSPSLRGGGDKFCLHYDIGKIVVVVVFLILLFDLLIFSATLISTLDTLT